MTLDDLISQERLREICKVEASIPKCSEGGIEYRVARLAALESTRNALEMAAKRAESLWLGYYSGQMVAGELRLLAKELKP
jgi:hypothetical protein